jgi:hypothetical protein
MAVSHSDNPYPGGPTPRPRQGGGGGSGKYQLPSDGFDGTARSGVIRSDGKWIPAEAGNPDWYEYVKWLEESPDNNPDPFLSPDDGGVEIKLEDNQSAVGSMIPSVRELDMPPPVEEPRRIPHRADIFTPPPVATDASHSPARDQRSDAYRPLSEEDRKLREEHAKAMAERPPEAGVWTQTQADDARHLHEQQGDSSQPQPRATPVRDNINPPIDQAEADRRQQGAHNRQVDQRADEQHPQPHPAHETVTPPQPTQPGQPPTPRVPTRR